MVGFVREYFPSCLWNTLEILEINSVKCSSYSKPSKKSHGLSDEINSWSSSHTNVRKYRKKITTNSLECVWLLFQQSASPECRMDAEVGLCDLSLGQRVPALPWLRDPVPWSACATSPAPSSSAKLGLELIMYKYLQLFFFFICLVAPSTISSISSPHALSLPLLAYW